MPKKLILLSALTLAASLAPAVGAIAQIQNVPVAASAGTLVVVPAFGEVRHVNDEVTLTLGVEEQDQQRTLAAARVNQKMKQGTEIVRRADPQAELKTVRYFTTPVYPEAPYPPRNLTPQEIAARRIPIGWRVSQELEVRTRNLANLPKVVAAAQNLLGVTRIDYHLSRELTKQMDDERIAATIRNLNERIASVARAMGRSVNDAVIDTVDFEGSGNYAVGAAPPPAPAYRRVEVTGSSIRREDLAEPSFEPGETTLQMRAVGKVRLR